MKARCLSFVLLAPLAFTAAEEPSEVAVLTKIKLSIGAPDDLLAELEPCLQAAFNDLAGVRIVTSAETYEIRILAIRSAPDGNFPRVFLSVLVLSPQRDGLTHLKFIEQTCPDSVRGRTPDGKKIPFPMSLPLGYIEEQLSNGFIVKQHFAFAAAPDELKGKCAALAAHVDETVLAPKRGMVREVIELLQDQEARK